MDVAALTHQLDVTINDVLDTQIMYEILTGSMFGSLNDVLSFYQIESHPNKKEVHNLMVNNADIWKIRPLNPKLLLYAKSDVICLYNAACQLLNVKESIKSPSDETLFGDF